MKDQNISYSFFWVIYPSELYTILQLTNDHFLNITSQRRHWIEITNDHEHKSLQLFFQRHVQGEMPDACAIGKHTSRRHNVI